MHERDIGLLRESFPRCSEEPIVQLNGDHLLSVGHEEGGGLPLVRASLNKDAVIARSKSSK